VTAARIAFAPNQTTTLDQFVDLTSVATPGAVAGAPGQIQWAVPGGCWLLFATYNRFTNHIVTLGAYPNPLTLVTDHLDRAGAQEVLSGVADPMLAALGGRKPDTLFIDSFEFLHDLPWTDALGGRVVAAAAPLSTSPAALIPLLFTAGGETEILKELFGLPLTSRYDSIDSTGQRLREEYENIRGELFRTEFLEPIHNWTVQHGIPLRLQAHGGFADYLDAYALVDIPETESLFDNDNFDFLKLASSAAHVAGHRIVSQEAFVSFASSRNSFGPEELRTLAGIALASGVNRIVAAGHPYPIDLYGDSWWWSDMMPLGLEGNSALQEGHPAWPVIGDLNSSFARVAYAMSVGDHRAEVAWLQPKLEYRQPNDFFFPLIAAESDQSKSIRAAGFVYDRVSGAALAGATQNGKTLIVGKAQYKALVLDSLPTATPAMLQSILATARAGVPVLALGELPARATGTAAADDATVVDLVTQLEPLVIKTTPSAVGGALVAAGTPAALSATDGHLDLYVDHRATSEADVFYVFNASDSKTSEELRIQAPATTAVVLDPDTGAGTPSASPSETVQLEVPARRGRVLVFNRK
jgi:hypothetical protein